MWSGTQTCMQITRCSIAAIWKKQAVQAYLDKLSRYLYFRRKRKRLSVKSSIVWFLWSNNWSLPCNLLRYKTVVSLYLIWHFNLYLYQTFFWWHLFENPNLFLKHPVLPSLTLLKKRSGRVLNMHKWAKRRKHQTEGVCRQTKASEARGQGRNNTVVHTVAQSSLEIILRVLLNQIEVICRLLCKA